MYRYASVAVRRSKTDKLDSIIIAKYGIDNWFSLFDYVSNSEIYDELKLLNNRKKRSWRPTKQNINRRKLSRNNSDIRTRPCL